MNNISNMIKLLPGHDYKINCWFDNGEEFVTIFRNTWKKIPYKVRRSILKYWRECGSYVGFELSNMWGGGCEPPPIAQVGNLGCSMKFRQSDFKILPELVAEFIIAHELAHVYQKACGRRPGGENEEENEYHADSLARDWGFNKFLFHKLLDLASRKDMNFEKACEKIKSEYSWLIDLSKQK